MSFCKCICFNNATIIPITDPTDPSKPCADCPSPLSPLVAIFLRYFYPQYILPILIGLCPSRATLFHFVDRFLSGLMLIRIGTRQFCLDYRLPICRGAVNDPTHGDDTVIGDISVVCFRSPPFNPASRPPRLPHFPLFPHKGNWVERDSRKDQLIVVLFLIVTTGLLVYALLRPYVQGWLEVYVPGRETSCADGD